jgi:hypothetical protein
MAALATRAWQVGSQLNVYTGNALHKAILYDVGREWKTHDSPLLRAAALPAT